MKKEYIIFDLDWTLIESMWDAVKIIINHLNKIEWFNEEYARYIFSTTAWTPLKKQIEVLFNDFSEDKIQIITDDIYEKLEKHEADFFEWIPEKVKNLSKDYNLFLTTWNSTKVAYKHLEKWWIIECFELIYWSEKVLKWKEHLEIFEEYSLDKNFYEKSIYVWDWDSDRLFANEKNIDFIHIWNTKKDKYEINSVNEIDKILDLLNK